MKYYKKVMANNSFLRASKIIHNLPDEQLSDDFVVVGACISVYIHV